MAELLINYSGSPDPVSGAAQQRDYHTSEHCTLNTTTSNHRVLNLFISTFFAMFPWSEFPSRLATGQLWNVA